MKISDKIERNTYIVLTLKDHADKYPELARLFRRTTTGAHLYAIMEHMRRAYDKPAYMGRYYAFSIGHLMEWSANELDIGGRSEVWQAHAIMLQDMGLIQRIRPNKDDKDPILKRLYEVSLQKTKETGRGYRPETLWAVPVYNKAALQRAEEVAAIYHAAKANTSHLTKADIIRIRGQERANQLYGNGFHVPAIQQELTGMLTATIQAQLAEDGYTTADKVYAQTEAIVIENVDQDKRREYLRALAKLWERQKNVIIIQAGAIKKRPKKEQMERYSLPDTKAIIIPAE